MLIKGQSRHYPVPSNVQHSKEMWLREVLLCPSNTDGEIQHNNKHAKTTMYCICLLFSILTFIQNSHHDPSVPQKWSGLFFQRKSGSSLASFRRYKSAPQHKPKKPHIWYPVLEGNFLQKFAIVDTSPTFLFVRSLFIGHLRCLNREIALLHVICKALEENQGKWKNRKIKFTRSSKNSTGFFLISQTN